MINLFKFRTDQPLHRIQNPHGSATFLTEPEAFNLKLNQQGFGNTSCPYVGFIDQNNPLFARKPDSNSSNVNLLEGNGYLLTVAPTRAGKGTGQVIPNLFGEALCW